MPVVIRLNRRGKKKRPFYRIVATDSRSPTDGRFREIIGTYNPFANPDTDRIKIDEAKTISWIKKGAQLSDTVKGLFSKGGLLKRISSREEMVIS
ncbi:MAG: 30S ribosomal protein S16 [Nitrospinae bacterium]|nr:30S ribosomal protein S16 [Nitrospinota bacterium]